MVYEYECLSKKCGVVSEVVQRLSDKPITKCPLCKRGKVIKLISLPAKAVVPGDPMQEYAKIKKEAKEIAQRIVRGDEQTIADIYGEGAPSNKLPKGATKQKTMDQVKGGKIKRSSK